MDLAGVLLPRFGAASCEAGNLRCRAFGSSVVLSNREPRSHEVTRATSALLFIAPSLEPGTPKKLVPGGNPFPCPSSLLDYFSSLTFCLRGAAARWKATTPSPPPPSTDINQHNKLIIHQLGTSGP